ncbi:jg8732 [Pararge aegeria aegeria]|uniref:Jg8732 protein n=1 Tax=Pararge aegeria aegeria TaxID=348720 RepID=A0A8S4S3A2_9NEOP|nr:jg8732 [Pararge aegeria aegeria]
MSKPSHWERSLLQQRTGDDDDVFKNRAKQCKEHVMQPVALHVSINVRRFLSDIGHGSQYPERFSNYPGDVIEHKSCANTGELPIPHFYCPMEQQIRHDQKDIRRKTVSLKCSRRHGGESASILKLPAGT